MSVERVVDVTLGGGRPYVPPDPRVRDYFADMLAPYGIGYDADRLAAGNQNTFTDLSDALVAALAPIGELDLVVIAHAVSDCDPRRCTAGQLSEVLPGNPLIFAISDQGPLAPFTALRAVQGYGLRRSLVIILDQSTAPYDEPALADFTDDHAVGLLLGEHGRTLPGAPRLREVAQYADLSPDEARDALAAHANATGGTGTLVLGPQLDPPPGPRPVVRVPRDRLCGAVWARLAGALPRAIVADYDPGSGRLGVATFSGDD